MKKVNKFLYPVLLSFFSLALQICCSIGVLSQDVQQIEAQMMRQAQENIEKYRKGDAVIVLKTPDGKVLKNATLEVHQKTHDFLFGNIIFTLTNSENPYKGELFKERYLKLFNLAIFPFYWQGYEQKPGFSNWQSMLPVIDWCKSNDITTKGHPLVWSTDPGTPLWLNNFSVDQTEDFLRTRVLDITLGFKGMIDWFDVVNEPVNVRTWEHKMLHPEDKEDWGVKEPLPLIADYVEKALRWAHQGNPDAILMINEYLTIADETTRMRFDSLLVELKKRNAPLGGIGLQSHEHRQDWFSPIDVWKTLDLYARFGYPIHITEFQPLSSGVSITGGWRTGTWTQEAQAEYAGQFYTLCFGHPAVGSITWWDLSDRDNFVPSSGLVDEEYNPKPAYIMLDKLINQTWKTNLTMQADKHGAVIFRGFYGQYDITMKTADGKTCVYPIHISKGNENKWEFTVGERK